MLWLNLLFTAVSEGKHSTLFIVHYYPVLLSGVMVSQYCLGSTSTAYQNSFSSLNTLNINISCWFWKWMNCRYELTLHKWHNDDLFYTVSGFTATLLISSLYQRNLILERKRCTLECFKCKSFFTPSMEQHVIWDLDKVDWCISAAIRAASINIWFISVMFGWLLSDSSSSTQSSLGSGDPTPSSFVSSHQALGDTNHHSARWRQQWLQRKSQIIIDPIKSITLKSW